jgi:hypothetical protein
MTRETVGASRASPRASHERLNDPTPVPLVSRGERNERLHAKDDDENAGVLRRDPPVDGVPLGLRGRDVRRQREGRVLREPEPSRAPAAACQGGCAAVVDGFVAGPVGERIALVAHVFKGGGGSPKSVAADIAFKQ